MKKLEPFKVTKSGPHYQAALWLKKTAKRSVSALMESYEKDAFGFFSSLGFTTRRVVIERRA